jgi:site-specific recombinase XerD
MRTFGVSSPDELRKIDHRAVMAWERLMREEERKEATTVRRSLAALSSLFTHLVKFGVVEQNPVRDVERPAVNRREGMTLAFSQSQAQDFGRAESREVVGPAGPGNFISRVAGRVSPGRDRGFESRGLPHEPGV